MYRFRPDYEMRVRLMNIQVNVSRRKAIMLMIQNNLDYAVAQHPHELITYGGNGAVFQNWRTVPVDHEIPIRNDRRTNLTMYSGHLWDCSLPIKKLQE
jgi:urocanate hydratase